MDSVLSEVAPRTDSSQKIPGPSHAHAILVGVIVPMVICTLFVLARVWSRAVILRVWGWDDTCNCLSWLGALALTILWIEATRFGEGSHIYGIPLSVLDDNYKAAYGIIITYQATLTLNKISVILLYIRIFINSILEKICWFVLAFVISFSIPLFIGQVLVCPVPGTGKLGLNPPHCMQFFKVLYISAALHAFTDALLMAIAVPKIYTLRVSAAEKAAMLVIFSLGFAIIGASITRAVIMHMKRSRDITWMNTYFDIATAMEVDISILCASAPLIRPLLRSIRSPWATFTAKSSHTASSNTTSHLEGRSSGGKGDMC